MQTSVSARRDRRNNASVAVSSPARFVLIASRIAGPDRLIVALRSEHDGTYESAKREAHILAAAVADRFGVQACADITDSDGMPLFSVSAGGAL